MMKGFAGKARRAQATWEAQISGSSNKEPSYQPAAKRSQKWSWAWKITYNLAFIWKKML